MERAVISFHVYRFGLFEADPVGGTLTRSGLRVKIQEQPFRVLIFLLERAGEVVTREELRHRLWPEGTFVDFDGSLNVILKKLRAAIDDDSDNPRFVETVPRKGYRFIAPVAVHAAAGSGVFSPAPVLAKSQLDTSVLTTFVPQRWRLHGLLYVSSVLALVFIAALAWFKWERARPVKRISIANPAPSPSVRKSIAVLGFHNVSGQAGDSWLGTAFSEMLCTELSSGEKLRLVSGEDVANLRLTSPWSSTDTLDASTTARIGVALNSDVLVLGSYTTLGEPDRGHLRVDVRLQDAKTGEILTEIAEIGNTDDLFQMVSRVGQRLREQLGVPRLDEADEAIAHATLPANREAARLYSLGLVKLREYDYEAARGLFEQAIAAEPSFPLAHSLLSRADMFLGNYDRAKAEAKRGLELAGGLPRVQKMEIEASYYQAITNRAKAAEIYGVLFNLFPDSLEFGLQLTKLQLESYHPDEAQQTIKQLRRLPPPARDDPSIDLREAYIVIPKDANAADRLFHSAVEKARAQGKKLVYATAKANLCLTNRQHLQNPPECREAYEIFLAAGNRDQAAYCLQLMAEAQRLTSHDQESIPLYGQAVRMFKEAGDREGTGVALNNLSLVFGNQGQWDRAETAYREAKQDFLAVNDKANTSAVIGNIADILVMRGKLQKAADMYRNSWEIADASGRARHEFPHSQHAALMLIEGNPAEALAEIEPQITSSRAYGGDPWELSNALVVLGDIQKTQGDLRSARKTYQEALELLKKANSSISPTQVSLAELSILEGHPEVAERMLHEAIADFEKNKNAGQELGGYVSLARALLAEGKAKESQEAIAHALKLTDLHDFPLLSLPLQLLEVRAEVAAVKREALGRTALENAQRKIQAIVEKSHHLRFYNIECDARLGLAELEMKNNPALGRIHLAALATETRNRGNEIIARQAEQIVGSAVSEVALRKTEH